MSGVINCVTRKLSTTKSGLRYWEENKELLSRSGFQPGDSISVSYDRGRIEITKDENGKNTVSRKKGDVPVIDIVNKKVSECFGDVKDVLVEMYEGRIVVTLTNLASKASERLIRMKNKIKSKVPLAMASLFMGIGGLDVSIASGLDAQGVCARLAWGNEMDTQIAELSLANNPLWKEGGKLMNMPVQDLDPAELGLEKPDILLAGLPCVGHSSMQTDPNKRGIFHPQAGLLFVDFLRIVYQCNPAVIVIEQSSNFAKDCSNPKDFTAQHAEFYTINRYLQDMGYNIHLKKVMGTEHGCLERRCRTLMVATTEGIEFEMPLPPENLEQKKLGDYLEPFQSIPEKSWSEMAYLSRKTQESSNNFSETLVDEESTQIPVFTATYAKRQPNTPIIKHPHSPELKRLATTQEHARIKGYDESLVAGASMSLGHKALGNSVQKPVFEFYGASLGAAIKGVA